MITQLTSAVSVLYTFVHFEVKIKVLTVGPGPLDAPPLPPLDPPLRFLSVSCFRCHM